MVPPPRLISLSILCLTYYSSLIPLTSSNERYCSPQVLSQHETDGVCGAQLSNTVDMFCMMNMMKKRSAKGKLSDIIVPKSRAHTFIDVNKRNGRGIYCECCVHQCSSEEMLGYCGSSGQKRDAPSIRDVVQSRFKNKPAYLRNSDRYNQDGYR